MEWKMPDLGEGVQEGEIVKWLVQEGETVTIDQHLVEIMTDKATMELSSSLEGRVEQLLIKEGEIAKVGQVLAVIGEGTAPPKERAPQKEEISSPPMTAKVAPETRRTTQVADAPSARPAKPLAAPTVRRLAREKGIDLHTVVGTGPGGRILQGDLNGKRKGVAPLVSAAVTERKETPAWVSFGPEERQPLKGLRRKIAEHMILSRKTAAHFTHFDEVDLTPLVALREKEKGKAQKAGVKLTYLSYFVKAAVEALKKFPQVNASIDEAAREVVLKKYYNVGVAVATPNGLMVPNIKKADEKNLYDIAKETVRLGEAARGNKILLEDLKGGTFTITNIGSIGGILSAPIINYPEAAILGMHQIKPKPVVVDEEVRIRHMMYLSVSADHRIVDGAEIAQFLNEMIKHLENPKEFLA